MKFSLTNQNVTLRWGVLLWRMNHSTVILDIMYTHTIVIAHKHTSQKVSKSNNNNTEMSPINDHFTSQKRVFSDSICCFAIRKTRKGIRTICPEPRNWLSFNFFVFVSRQCLAMVKMRARPNTNSLSLSIILLSYSLSLFLRPLYVLSLSLLLRLLLWLRLLTLLISLSPLALSPSFLNHFLCSYSFSLFILSYFIHSLSVLPFS